MMYRFCRLFITLTLATIYLLPGVPTYAQPGIKAPQQAHLRPYHVRWKSGNVYIESKDSKGAVISKKAIPHNKDTRVYPGQELVTYAGSMAVLNIGEMSINIDPKSRCKIEEYQASISSETAGATRNLSWSFKYPSPNARLQAKDFSIAWYHGTDIPPKVNVSLYAEGKDDPFFTKSNIESSNGTIDPTDFRKALANYKGKKPVDIYIVVVGPDNVFHITWFTLIP